MILCNMNILLLGYNPTPQISNSNAQNARKYLVSILRVCHANGIKIVIRHHIHDKQDAMYVSIITLPYKRPFNKSQTNRQEVDFIQTPIIDSHQQARLLWVMLEATGSSIPGSTARKEYLPTSPAAPFLFLQSLVIYSHPGLCTHHSPSQHP